MTKLGCNTFTEVLCKDLVQSYETMKKDDIKPFNIVIFFIYGTQS